MQGNCTRQSHSPVQVDIYAALAGTRESFQEYIRTNLAAAAQSQRRLAIAIARRCAHSPLPAQASAEAWVGSCMCGVSDVQSSQHVCKAISVPLYPVRRGWQAGLKHCNVNAQVAGSSRGCQRRATSSLQELHTLARCRLRRRKCSKATAMCTSLPASPRSPMRMSNAACPQLMRLHLPAQARRAAPAQQGGPGRLAAPASMPAQPLWTP